MKRHLPNGLPRAASLAPVFLAAIVTTAPTGPSMRGIRGAAFAAVHAAACPEVEQSRIATAYGKLPLAFEANWGQARPGVRFLARGPGYTLALAPTEAALFIGATTKETHHQDTKARGSKGDESLVPWGPGGEHRRDHRRSSARVRVAHTAGRGRGGSRSVLRMRLVGAKPAAEIVGTEPL